MHHEICARTSWLREELWQQGRGAGALKNLTPVTKTGRQVTRGQVTRGLEGLCHVKRLARLCAQETMRFLREEEHWEVGCSEGMQGQG